VASASIRIRPRRRADAGEGEGDAEKRKTVVADIKAGTAFWEPGETHMAENIGGSRSRCLLIEIKDKEWRPSTG
jgi:hypothetical protein